MPRRFSREMDERTDGSSTPSSAMSRIRDATGSQPPASRANAPYVVTMSARGFAPERWSPAVTDVP
jgi:hypothetical protein